MLRVSLLAIALHLAVVSGKCMQGSYARPAVGTSFRGLHARFRGLKGRMPVRRTGDSTAYNSVKDGRERLVAFGRRSAKIAGRKGAQDAIKTKLYTKIGKMVADAVKSGGSDPESNPKLATIMKQAQTANVPKDIIKRNIDKGESGKANYEEFVYEAYGAGGVGFVIECMTDNPTIAQRDVKQALKKGLGKWAEPGSVSFNFARRGVIRLPSEGTTEDEVFEPALDAGAEDVVSEEEFIKVLTEVSDFHSVQTALVDAGLPVIGDQCGLEMVPVTKVEVSDEDAEVNEDILSRLLDIDDVDAVYSTMSLE
mmetsp:Transcript_18102/g.27151  ORF Transcript_18102/g.27151 Transcript_18102/m.27151 type:complete len:310 (-) Transcript_18102:158-1087(-)